MNKKTFWNEFVPKLLRALLFLVIIHLVALVMRAVFLGMIIGQSVEAEDGIARVVTIGFSFIITLILSIYRAVELARNGKERRAFLNETADTPLSLRSSLKRCVLNNRLQYILFAILQFPFLIFFVNFGYYYTGGTILEKFYSLEAGFYVLTGFGVVGFFLSIAYYALLQTVFELWVYHLWNRERIAHE